MIDLHQPLTKSTNWGTPEWLGGFLVLLFVATFALNNASVRARVLTGSMLQGMAITAPVGAPAITASQIAPHRRRHSCCA